MNLNSNIQENEGIFGIVIGVTVISQVVLFIAAMLYLFLGVMKVNISKKELPPTIALRQYSSQSSISSAKSIHRDSKLLDSLVERDHKFLGERDQLRATTA